MSLSDHINKKTDNYSLGSKKKLRASMQNKIKRTFVGILDSLESELDKNNPRELELFHKLRRKVLSIGNDQIRNMENELEKYNVEFIPYHIEMQVKPLDNVPLDNPIREML